MLRTVDRASFFALHLQCAMLPGLWNDGKGDAHDDGEVGGCLVTSQEETPGKDGVMIYLNASGRLDEAVAAVPMNGGSVIKSKHAIGPFGFRAIVIDSEGNRVALHSE